LDFLILDFISFSEMFLLLMFPNEIFDFQLIFLLCYQAVFGKA